MINSILSNKKTKLPTTTLNDLLDPIVEAKGEFAGTIAPFQDVNVIKEEILKSVIVMKVHFTKVPQGKLY